ncbi:phosphate ABC transporter permease PstA [Leptolyngbya boryana CZ1]|jgi:phosphate transport system permease protein|uniref:Phosphate transport system permease protein PstA n=2 Tax=Leptolyngbya boryana TaxID=1184 RepID=A0A1Z4JL32_LEPBY|nr:MULTISPECIES: phosphate ABC transporter permease PstA [Leptolyngbya]BAY57469.1 phosphate ABC transporter permease [Leptolyngbya boryana NIES-2135]MBD2368595.1 phosphate ABC transporter permease PstA [Leptolyngbya sp. FACHB-161]MBD2375144.1 phosphate ABC transporter permease PstA [Leptolyngbya sp. FACHB-238]MBD2399563.1 phosphate ABC transporter permease PstA [Leptolyngbya sp. FACHB-239]MBD2405768.1 phosphate ABC transporter permease PstA [Leptolyngbya sp. FACHB-402]
MSSFFDRQLTKPLSVDRRLFSYGMSAIAVLLTGLALLPLLSILFEILRQGLPNLRWEVLTNLPAPVGEAGVVSGFANAIQGTVLMVGLAAMMSIPFGILTAIYLVEIGRGNTIAQIVRFVMSILSAVPSIVVGVFAYAVIVLSTILGYRGFSALAGAFALAVIMLPIIVLSTEEALKLVPTQQRLASAALGANSIQTTFKVVLKAALPSITTGVLLAIARVSGETAPLLFTALFSQNWVEQALNPTPSLSVMIYNYASSAFPEQNQLAWSASVVLLGIVILTNLLSRLITRRHQ